MDKASIKQRDLYEVGLEEGECFKDKMNTLVEHVIPKHVFFTKKLMKRVLI